MSKNCSFAEIIIIVIFLVMASGPLFSSVVTAKSPSANGRLLLKELQLQVKRTYVSSKQVFVCQYQGQPLSALYGKPRPLPHCHTRCSCVQGVSIHQKTLQISLAVTVCCHTLESHSRARWVYGMTLRYVHNDGKKNNHNHVTITPGFGL